MVFKRLRLSRRFNGAKNPRKRANALWRENRGFLMFVALMLLFRSALADWNHVPTGSMKPTILEGDHILINKTAYDYRLPFVGTSLHEVSDPNRGDIIIFNSEASGKRLVKRVVGIPGDRVSLVDNKLTVNGHSAQYRVTHKDPTGRYHDLTEALLGQTRTIRITASPSHYPDFSEVTVPQGYYLALGDNRNNSADSRAIGLVPRNEIIGRTQTVAYSVDYDRYLLPRAERFFKTLL